MNRLLLWVAAAMVFQAGVFVSGAVVAQNKDAKPTAVEEMSFEGDLVEAQFLRPDQGVTEALLRKKRSSLIKLRTDFVDEILKSAEDL
ncbi:MAG TPA: hypothetical protein PKH54_01750 [Myxococcota bacterium]|nr:hypothetical protein [Myxococcota bacterium]HOA12455.1 hypothetical protein [Myxococcota bacterium]HOC98640.1 hypothetical protein [Myxococcota bacterium]HOH75760.1 hypothetical protein [Myxococcota bacterium]HPV03294.1 hypothetical protein [Myxococcota bacterium]